MIVVADTGPLRYLVEIDAVHALPILFGNVLTTPDVVGELNTLTFPDNVRT